MPLALPGAGEYGTAVALRIAIVGPGRVGTAFAKQFAAGRAVFLGFVGRDPAHVQRALQQAGAGAALTPAELGRAHVVVFAVGDGELVAAVRSLAAATPPRPCSLWLHTSGRFGLEVFDGVAGCRRGALHPVAPFVDPVAAASACRGAVALVESGPGSRRLLHVLCELLAMQPIDWPGGDRTLYHAACALAANGTTALWAQVEAVFGAAGLPPVEARRLCASLVPRAAALCQALGPAEALSGPVRRGDVPTVVAHRQGLAGAVPSASSSYQALMLAALQLACTAGLPEERAAAVRKALLQP